MGYNSAEKDAQKQRSNNASYNTKNREYAQDNVLEQLTEGVYHFITDHPNDDVIVDLGTLSSGKLITQMKAIIKQLHKSILDRHKDSKQKIYFEDIGVDAVGISSEQTYTKIETNVEKKSTTVGGGIDGYSVTETSDGFSVTPHYSREETEYYFEAVDEYVSDSVFEYLNIKAVRLGTGKEVVKKEKALSKAIWCKTIPVRHKEDSLYRAALAYKKGSGQEYKQYFPFTPSQSLIYNIAFLIGVISVLLWSVSIASCAISYHGSLIFEHMFQVFWFERLLCSLFEYNIAGIFDSYTLLWVCAVISFISLILMLISRKAYRDKYGESTDKNRLRKYTFIFILQAINTAFLYTAYLLPELNIVGIIPRIFAMPLTFSGGSLICVLFFIIFIFVGLRYLIKGEATKESAAFVNEVKEFIKNGGIEMVENLMSDISTYTTNTADDYENY